MRHIRSTLYAALLLSANAALPAHAAGADLATLEALRDGDMQKLVLLAAPKPLPDGALETVLLDPTDGEHTLADYAGKYVLLNFWATWCAPCRKEMPSLDRVQATLGSDTFVVIPIATGRNSVEGIAKFFTEADITSLTTLRDPNMELSRNMGVLGLPITVILNPQGQEIARLIGDAEWDSPSATAILTAITAP